MLSDTVIHEFLRADVGVVRRGEPLSAHSTWGIGGPADLFIEPSSKHHISGILRVAGKTQTPVVVIGGGSNLLFDDEGVRAVVVRIGPRLAHTEVKQTDIHAEAGVAVGRVVRMMQDFGLSGLEDIVGIPATLGGLVAMNGGDPDHPVGNRVVKVEAIDASGVPRTFARERCGFGYRSSVFLSNRSIVTSILLRCQPDDPGNVRRKVVEFQARRKKSQPLEARSCGSVFARDAGMMAEFGPPGRVIEDAGLKGARIGDAEVSPMHANFIVNRGRARSSDVLQLIAEARNAVRGRTGILMACEVRYVSPTGTTMAAHEALEHEDVR